MPRREGAQGQLSQGRRKRLSSRAGAARASFRRLRNRRFTTCPCHCTWSREKELVGSKDNSRNAYFIGRGVVKRYWLQTGILRGRPMPAIRQKPGDRRPIWQATRAERAKRTQRVCRAAARRSDLPFVAGVREWRPLDDQSVGRSIPARLALGFAVLFYGAVASTRSCAMQEPGEVGIHSRDELP